MAITSFKKIILIGPPTSGKTTVAMLLSKKMAIPHFDLDQMIERKFKVSIQELFDKKKESYFRLLESQCLKDFSKKRLPSQFVLSTGGGSVDRADTLTLLKQMGSTVYLKTPIKNVLKRGAEQNHAFFKNKSAGEIKTVIQSRECLYTQSHLTIDTSDKSCHIVMKELLKKIKQLEE